ncbi:transforming growth factor beta activator LRRC32 [Salarias fasciatus]|uniref:Transforming growth factor beta activator LRRC32-like n=1 Tax=Salarias fasciatus TaxID=181472 RepID=A0A672I9U3_SALFA|nr:transforming growth factor beta activator LRRC32-like [Salarias fasciatus]XP_029942529.1 transforming growth factor beta activator LRRC32-like [Salarias fasciatus]XP_029942530.1 transforming growth factor beta activator LRRC32-like [Salarias fasciatus]XP_029942531.1 transforming growth factor beta activator LRRC32-like [Salarias fasciatus]XP_029942532.1 transforming growth factor beta activator LRRC32-like [Salarias fasciatus]XP_029942533.1 transforming growth factor beta activator LRRC32-l
MMAAVQLLLLMVGCMAASARRPRDVPPCQVVQSQVFCSDLSLSAVPVPLPHGVQLLDLSRNRVQNLTRETLAFHTGLQHLDLHSNRIRFIQPGLFGTMSQLRVLDLSRNRLSVFAQSGQSVGALASVQSLDLSHNGLFTGMSDSFLADSPALQNLSLEGNSITRISRTTFSGSLALRRISLRDNVVLEIEDGAFDSLDQLTDLDLSRNSISCITDFNLYSLERLNLSRNSVERFHSAPAGVFRLLALDLSQNNMLYFPVLPENNVLEHLDVSHNRLQSVNASGSPDREPSRVFNRLRVLDLSFNRLRDLPQCFFYCMALLRVLNVSHNCVPAFSVSDPDVLARVRTVDLSFNALRSLAFGEDALQRLEDLFLQGNQLRTVDQNLFQRLSGLRYLQLDQNRLEVCATEQNRRTGPEPSGCVSLSSVRNLHFLYLSGNHLRTLPADAFSHTPLQLLDLSQNPGLDLHADSLRGLETSLVHLLLRENDLSSLSTDLSALRGLRHVDLSTNRLSRLPAWTRESGIESLNLQNNSLVTLEPSTMAALERSLKTLYVGSNPLRCCDSLGVVRLVRRAAVRVPDIEAVTCRHRDRPDPLSLRRVTEDMCRAPRLPGYLAAALLALLAAALALGLLVKCCRARRHKGSRSFSA